MENRFFLFYFDLNCEISVHVQKERTQVHGVSDIKK